MTLVRSSLALALCAALASCQPDRLTPGEGFAKVPGGRVWYRIVGGGEGTPLVVLHGGPGAPSYYLASLARLGAERPVVFYDQLGTGRSDQPSDTTLWRIQRFMAELDSLRSQLGLGEITSWAIPGARCSRPTTSWAGRPGCAASFWRVRPSAWPAGSRTRTP